MLEKIQNMLREIRCYHTANEIVSIIEQAKQNDLSYLDFLKELLTIEMQNRMKTKIRRFLKIANFPVLRTIEEFDFRFQTSITRKEVNEWLTFSWLEQKANKILMGAPGVGKTHLALGTGYSAVYKGYKVIFFTMQTLMEDMIIADKGGQFNEFIKKIMKNDLIIIDELGYIPFKSIYSNLFFQLINSCYENVSLMITSNKLFNEWGILFNDQTIATAILDRLLHHCEPIVLNGDSYRLKNIEGKI
ncbi:MAG: IS21-like element helper ATPase IstB [Candidatus Cloacimonetes bacterium]|nr:IS21-like element helper ATPase IstB [Candidatus Cloacimonadota bacterium]